MVKLSPLVQIILTGVGAAVGVIAATADSLPIAWQAVIVGVSTIFAALGIVPPHVTAIGHDTAVPTASSSEADKP